MTGYEKEIISLFSQLAVAIKDYSRALYNRAFSNSYKEATQLQIDLNDLASKICDLIEEIKISFDKEKSIENIDRLSDEIQELAANSIALKAELYSAKRKNNITASEIQSFNNVLNNLHYLDKIIKEYNANFTLHLLTLEQGIKKFNEELDEMFFKRSEYD